LVSHWEWVRSASNDYANFRAREREREKEITDSSPFFGKFTQAKVLAFEADKNLGRKRRRWSISWGYDGDIIGI